MLINAMIKLSILALIWSLSSPSNASKDLTFTAIENTTRTELISRKLTAAYQEMGISINVIYLPAARAEKELNKTNIDGELYRIIEFADSHPELIMIEEPVDNFNAVALSFENVTLDENNPNLGLYTVGIRRGIIFSEKLTAHFQPIAVDSNAQLIDMLYMNRIDVAIMSKQNAQQLMHQKNEYKKIKMTPIATYNLYHFLKKKHKHLAEGVSKNLKKLY